MAILTFDQIKNAEDRTYQDVEAPEWGGTVRLRVMGSAVRRAFEKHLADVEKDLSVDTRALLVGACMCDEALTHLCVRFDAEQQPQFVFDNIKALAAKSNVPIVRLFKVAKTLNVIGDEEDDAEKK